MLPAGPGTMVPGRGRLCPALPKPGTAPTPQVALVVGLQSRLLAPRGVLGSPPHSGSDSLNCNRRGQGRHSLGDGHPGAGQASTASSLTRLLVSEPSLPGPKTPLWPWRRMEWAWAVPRLRRRPTPGLVCVRVCVGPVGWCPAEGLSPRWVGRRAVQAPACPLPLGRWLARPPPSWLQDPRLTLSSLPPPSGPWPEQFTDGRYWIYSPRHRRLRAVMPSPSGTVSDRSWPLGRGASPTLGQQGAAGPRQKLLGGLRKRTGGCGSQACPQGALLGVGRENVT